MWLFGFYVILNFVGYLSSNRRLNVKTVQFKINTQFKCKNSKLLKLFQTIQFGIRTQYLNCFYTV